MLNTLIAVLVAVVVIVALNAFLFVGYYLPRMTTAPPLPPHVARTTTLERTTVEKTQPAETRPRRTSEETTTSSATATATVTAAPLAKVRT